MDGEHVIADTKPVFFSFLSFYIPGIYLVAAGALLFVYGRQELLPMLPTQISPKTTQLLYYLIEALCIVIPALIYSFARLNFRWLLSALILVAGAGFIKHGILDLPLVPTSDLSEWELNAELLIVFSMGVVSMAQNELYRQTHHYLVTNLRITTSAGILRKRQRTLLLSKINDLSVDESFAGTILRYGTMIPLTASGLGMGTTFAAASGEASKRLFGLPTLGVRVTGGHSIQIPKYRTHEVLFGVRHAQRIAAEVMDVLVQRELDAARRPE